MLVEGAKLSMHHRKGNKGCAPSRRVFLGKGGFGRGAGGMEAKTRPNPRVEHGAKSTQIHLLRKENLGVIQNKWVVLGCFLFYIDSGSVFFEGMAGARLRAAWVSALCGFSSYFGKIHLAYCNSFCQW